MILIRKQFTRVKNEVRLSGFVVLKKIAQKFYLQQDYTVMRATGRVLDSARTSYFDGDKVVNGVVKRCENLDLYFELLQKYEGFTQYNELDFNIEGIISEAQESITDKDGEDNVC